MSGVGARCCHPVPWLTGSAGCDPWCGLMPRVPHCLHRLVASLPSLVHLDLRWDSHRSGTQGNDLALAPIVEAVERSEHIVQVLTNPVDDGLDALRARLDKVVGRNRQRREEAAQCVADCSGLPPGLRAIIMAYAFAAVPLLAEAAGAGASEGKEA